MGTRRVRIVVALRGLRRSALARGQRDDVARGLEATRAELLSEQRDDVPATRRGGRFEGSRDGFGLAKTLDKWPRIWACHHGRWRLGAS